MNVDELALIEGMFNRIQRLSSWHCRIEGYYEGSNRVRDLGVAIPSCSGCKRWCRGLV